MLVDAKEQFLQRMAGTINMAMHTDGPAEMAKRFERHELADVKKAQALAARARADEMKRNR